MMTFIDNHIVTATPESPSVSTSGRGRRRRRSHGICAIAIGIIFGVATSHGEGPTSRSTTQAANQTSAAEITATLAQIRQCLDSRIVVQFTDPASGKLLQYPPEVKLPSEAMVIGPSGYPCAVIYAAMLSAGEATKDKAFVDFVANRFDFFARTIPMVPQYKGDKNKLAYHRWLAPENLDACGAMGAAFVKARRAGVGGDLKPEIDRFAEFATSRQFRLTDGTLARRRPYPDSIWADDMYMSVPLLAQMGALTNDPKYFDDAARQVTQMSGRLFVPSMGLYTHGWNAGAGDNAPHYFWGRANGWCAMAMVELLEVLPADHPQHAAILTLLQAHAKGIASVQSGDGLWHQMLDRPDSPLETSCSAMFTFAMARAVNRGWLDAGTYGPVAIAGWKGVTTRISPDGHVTGTCEGTSYAMDYPYYYNRKFADDQHGYGPVLFAGAEIVQLLNNPRHLVHMEPGRPVLVLPVP